jgi:hypothetical protein
MVLQDGQIRSVASNSNCNYQVLFVFYKNAETFAKPAIIGYWMWRRASSFHSLIFYFIGTSVYGTKLRLVKSPATLPIRMPILDETMISTEQVVAIQIVSQVLP